VALFILINLVVYLVITIPLDIATYTGEQPTRKKVETPPAWKKPLALTIAFITSGYLWLLFIIVPLTAVVHYQLFYELMITPSSLVVELLQVMGLVLIAGGTIVACWGRINRGKEAMSWGIPRKLVKKGIYKYIRHPLYSRQIDRLRLSL
jgi:protein-S-isoprenylcysteine O-methyltransferase Ste14